MPFSAPLHICKGWRIAFQKDTIIDMLVFNMLLYQYALRVYGLHIPIRIALAVSSASGYNFVISWQIVYGMPCYIGAYFIKHLQQHSFLFTQRPCDICGIMVVWFTNQIYDGEKLNLYNFHEILNINGTISIILDIVNPVRNSFCHEYEVP